MCVLGGCGGGGGGGGVGVVDSHPCLRLALCMLGNFSRSFCGLLTFIQN